MTPHEVLGVAPTATPDEIETAYHRRLRECHPDLHWADGPEAVAEAERRTRALTAAMAQLRRGWAQGPRASDPSPRPPRPSTTSSWREDTWNSEPRPQHETWGGFGYRPDPDHDWFGNPVDRRVRADHVDCPLCGAYYDDPDAYRYHLAAVHQIDRSAQPSRHESRPSLEGIGQSLGWVPWPTFWFGIALLAYWAIVVAVVPILVLRIAAIWIGTIGYLVVIRLAFKHRRAR